MNLEQFSTVVDDRRYINPQVGLDESNAFIENLRNTQQANTQEIAQDTYNLGTAVPSNLGGLGGAGTYFASRYQTPQTNEVIANLRSAAQAQALNEAMSNELAKAKERYNQAYRAAKKRSGGTTGGNPANPTNPANQKLPVDTNGKKDTTVIGPGGSDTVVENTWAGAPYKSSVNRYRANGLEWIYDSSSPLSSASPLSSPLVVGKDGTIKKIGGKTYIAINRHWYPVIKSPL